MRIKSVENLSGVGSTTKLRVTFERAGREISKHVYLHTPIRLCTQDHRLSFMLMADKAAVEAHRDFLVQENSGCSDFRSLPGFNERFPALAVEISKHIT